MTKRFTFSSTAMVSKAFGRMLPWSNYLYTSYGEHTSVNYSVPINFETGELTDAALNRYLNLSFAILLLCRIHTVGQSFELCLFLPPLHSNFGVGYLYKGLEAKLLQSVIAAGFMFLTYEQIAAVIFALFGIEKK